MTRRQQNKWIWIPVASSQWARGEEISRCARVGDAGSCFTPMSPLHGCWSILLSPLELMELFIIPFPDEVPTPLALFLQGQTECTQCCVNIMTCEVNKVQFRHSSVQWIETIQHPSHKVRLADKKKKSFLSLGKSWNCLLCKCSVSVSILKVILSLSSLLIQQSSFVEDKKDILEKLDLTHEDLEDTFQRDTLLYLQAAVCWANPVAHANARYCMTLSWDDLFPRFFSPRCSETEMRQQHCKLFPRLGRVWEIFLLYECAAGVFIPFSCVWSASHVDSCAMTQVFVSLWGLAAARAPSAWLISFILVASKQARGVGKGASMAALLAKKKAQITELCSVAAGDLHVWITVCV